MISKYRHKKWEIRAAGFIFAALIFACFADSEGLAYVAAMGGVTVNTLLAGICEFFDWRWSWWTNILS